MPVPNDFGEQEGADELVGPAGVGSRKVAVLPFNRREPAASRGLPARRLDGRLAMFARRRQCYADPYACRA